METIKTITTEQKALIDAPLPAEAVKPHPTKNFLSTIKAIYVTERLNDVFGVGRWSIKTDAVDTTTKMIIVKTTLDIPEYGIHYECFGGNDNADRGDAYKGATTDAITKIGSWLGIGADVFKGLVTPQAKAAPQQAESKHRISAEDIANAEVCNKFLEWMYNRYALSGYSESFNPRSVLLKYYDVYTDVATQFVSLFESYKIARNGK